jgi:hypothetical protein
MRGLVPTDHQPDETGELLFYQTEDGQNRVQLRLHDGTVWLTQKQLSDLYQVSVKTVNEHLVNDYEEGELSPEATIRKFRIVQIVGNRQVSRLVDHYRLEAILSVGYRVRSHRGVQFRRWATSQLQELLVKGFVMDDQRLKEGRSLGSDYFDELNRIVVMYLDYAEDQARKRQPLLFTEPEEQEFRRLRFEIVAKGPTAR